MKEYSTHENSMEYPFRIIIGVIIIKLTIDSAILTNKILTKCFKTDNSIYDWDKELINLIKLNNITKLWVEAEDGKGAYLHVKRILREAEIRCILRAFTVKGKNKQDRIQTRTYQRS